MEDHLEEVLERFVSKCEQTFPTDPYAKRIICHVNVFSLRQKTESEAFSLRSMPRILWEIHMLFSRHEKSKAVCL
jgi:hypothetical protein